MAAGGLSARCGAAAARAERTRGQRGGGPGSRCGRTALRGTGDREGSAGRGRSAGPGGFNCGGARAGLAPPPPRARGEAPPPPRGTLRDPPAPKSGARSGCRGFLWLLYSVRDESLARALWEPLLWRGRGLDLRSPRGGAPQTLSSPLRVRGAPGPPAPPAPLLHTYKPK